jgi:hypothetical protein
MRIVIVIKTKEIMEFECRRATVGGKRGKNKVRGS